MTALDKIKAKGKAINGSSFWCDVLHQQVLTRACMAYYKKGKKACEGCEIGRALLNAEISRIKSGNNAPASAKAAAGKQRNNNETEH